MDDFSLPGYAVEELVGFGGSGEVWRARDLSTGELVALKRLRGDAATAISAKQLQREAALLATVRHDHVVALRSVVPTSDGLVLVLDYVEGGSLAAVLAARGRLSAGEVVTIGAPLAQALSDIHGKGLTHGDVTPGNIVFDGSGKPLLADLGVASLIGEAAPPAGRTPGYADPAHSVGPASDVHGLAAVCFSALAGVAPYTDSDPMQAQSLGPLAPSVPPALVAVIEAALDPDPAARPDAASFSRAVFASCSPVAVRLARASQPTGGAPAALTQAVAGSLRATESTPDADTPSASRFRRGAMGRHRWSTSRPILLRRTIAAACVVALLGTAVAVGVAWGWADHGHRASASVPVTPPASPASGLTDGSPSSPASGLTDGSPSSSASQPAVGAAMQSTTDPTAGGSTPIASPTSDWLAVVAALDRSRDDAFANADANELDTIYVPGSAALAADSATLGRVVGAGQRVRGLHFILQSVRVVSQSAGEVTLAVVDTLAGYDVVDAGGVTTHLAGRGVRTWSVVLRTKPPDELRWRIASITPA